MSKEISALATATVALTQLAEKEADIDMLRQMVQFMAQRLMELDVEARCGAGHDGKRPRSGEKPQRLPRTHLRHRCRQLGRRTNVVGIFPDDASITRLVGAMMLEQNDESSLTRC